MAVEEYDIEWLQEQIYELKNSIRNLEATVEQLQIENTLLKNDLNTIKMEGCWRVIENPKHQHKQQCSKCGMTFEGITNYYCPQTDCPIFLKPR